MNQKQVLVEHLSDISSILKRPLQGTQRIKFTCFDISEKYIVFGATSGGLYVFNRYPYVFMKLIPSKYGSVVQVAIASNEKTIALASSKGLVIVIQNCFTEVNVQYQVYSEHERNLVTAMKWHSDDLYCGDNKGVVTVIVLSNLLTKAIFQSPCASLMQLDSSIVQIESYSKFLLISTNTRTCICDTDKEQYQQIGKKLRNGRFGACFFTNGVNPEEMFTHAFSNKGLFKIMKDDEQFTAHVNDNIKILCARPGARIWEAKLDASVVRTHQFKSFLKQEPTSLLHMDEAVNSHLKIANFSQLPANAAAELFNFSKVYVLGRKFIFTFNTDGFYVFNPETADVICWCYYFNKIRDVKTVKNFIYIWNESGELRVVALYDLEKIILKTLFKKQYYICGELCLNYIDDVIKLLEISEKIHYVSILKEKLAELEANNTIQNLARLFEAIKECCDKKCNDQRSSKGIVVVNNAFIDEGTLLGDSIHNKYEKDQSLPETLQTLKEIGTNVTEKLTESTKNLKEKFQVLEATVKSLTLSDKDIINTEPVTVDLSNDVPQYQCKYDPSEEISENKIQPKDLEPKVELNANLKIFCLQYEATKINSSIEVAKFSELLLSKNLNDIVELFLGFKEHMLKKDADEAKINMWFYKRYLKHASKINFETEIENLDVEDRAIYFLSEAFRSVNVMLHGNCKCLFPLPMAKRKLPDFYDVGCSLLKKLYNVKHESFKEIQQEVPFMWKYIIQKWRNNDDINVLLPLLMQYGDEELLSMYLNKFKYDTWDNAVQLLIKLKQNICVNCDNKFKKRCDSICWTEFGTLMVQSIGGPSAIKLLTRYASIIPSHELDTKFYQTCIFATAADNLHEGLRNKAVNLTRSFHSDIEASLQFDKKMANFLQKDYTKKAPECLKTILLPTAKTDLKCSFCDLQIDIPVLDGTAKLECNHLYHTICLKHNNNICKICKK